MEIRRKLLPYYPTDSLVNATNPICDQVTYIVAIQTKRGVTFSLGWVDIDYLTRAGRREVLLRTDLECRHPMYEPGVGNIFARAKMAIAKADCLRMPLEGVLDHFLTEAGLAKDNKTLKKLHRRCLAETRNDIKKLKLLEPVPIGV